MSTPTPNPSANPWSVLDDVARRSQRYLTPLAERSVVPTAEALAAIAAFDTPLQARNVNTGAFDPFAEITPAARENDAPVWVHIDGAFGLWARVAPERAHLAAGVELADYWATDAHKWLNSPYDCGVALVREPGAHAASMRGRRCAPGRRGLAELVERNCRQARRFADAFAAVQNEGTCWCGVTVWQGHTAMRVSVISWATTDDDVDRSVAAILRIARQVT